MVHRPPGTRSFGDFLRTSFDVAPVELFFNDYYHPGLLADLYAGKRPVAPQNISQKDRRQPTVTVAVNEAQVAAEQIRSRTIGVKVEVSQAPAGAQDVRLFRNGALVKAWRGDVLKGQSRVVLEAQIPIVAGQNVFTAYAFNRDNVKSADATLRSWVTIVSDSRARFTFSQSQLTSMRIRSLIFVMR